MFIAAALANRFAIATLETALAFTIRTNHVAVIGRTEIIALAIFSALFTVFALLARALVWPIAAITARIATSTRRPFVVIGA
jgi:hypothetical protein